MVVTNSGKFLLALIVGVCCASALANAASGATASDFNASVNVKSDNACSLEVTPPASTGFTAEWTASVASNTSTFVNTTQDTNPHYIRVVALGGDACNVNSVEFVTNAGTDVVMNGRPAHPFGNNGGYWRYNPSFANLIVYTDTAATQPTTDTITVHTANGNRRTPQKNPVQKAGAVVYNNQLGNYMSLTDNYLEQSSNTMLTTDHRDSGVSTYTSANSAASYKALDMGVGVAIQIDPVNASNKVEREVAADGDVVVIPFTVTVSQS